MRSDAEEAVRKQFLSFVLAGGEYGLPILKVKEILQFDGLTPVPGTVPSVRGVINLRGSVVPVVDLATKFGLGETRATTRTCVLVVEATVEGQPALVGLLADAVSEVMELSAEDIEPPPRLAGSTTEYLLGMGKVERRFVLLLDVDRVLSLDEQAAAAALRGAPPHELVAAAAARAEMGNGAAGAPSSSS